TREITTQVLVKDQQTIVLGGIYEEADDHQIERVPFISDIPVLGKLFEHQHEQKEKRELLIFVRPKIQKDTLPE
ncbi:MAG: fimbrial assembly protein, partial [Gammaproteobacteria bacterium]|nr:fimbrial assembly protein [Gammaproteobacteria bacterium]